MAKSLAMKIIPSDLTNRKDQLTLIINLIFVLTGIVFIVRDFFADYLVDGFWSVGSFRLVELIVIAVINIALINLGAIQLAKLITSLALIIVFFISPIFITLNYLEMYYINTLLLPVIVLIPSMVFYARENKNLILFFFIFALASNFLFELIIFRFKEIKASDLEFYAYHFDLFSLAKVFTSLFIYINITRLFRQNEKFEETIINTNRELNDNNSLINFQKNRIEQQNEELKKTEEQLRKLDIAKSNFFSNISHEFRTPLTLLLSPLAERISNSTDSNDKEQLEAMQRNAKRLLNLVNQLLDLSKLESGSLKLQASRGDVTLFLKQLASQFASIATSRQIEFKFESPVGIYVWFDPDKLEKIITNLLGNAFKFTADGGNVSLFVQAQTSSPEFKNGCLSIEISDSGIGIEHDKQAKIFDRFYQVSDSSHRAFGGTGIGLALVKELVGLHQGTISVISQLNQGSIFTVKIPLGDYHLEANEMINDHFAPTFDEKDLYALEATNNALILTDESKEEKPSVLIVEDNLDLQKYLGQSLRDHYKISFAANGEEGRSFALASQPDLIVSDLMMPQVDGMELLKQLKHDEKTSHIPILLLTAKADLNTKLAGIETGADDYMAKPFEMMELKARVHNLIESRRLLREKFSTVKEIRPNDIKAESLEDKFLKKVLLSIDSHISDDTFGVDVLAREVAMSNIQLYRKTKALTGKTPNDLIRNMRLDRAKNLLEQKSGNVSEVAYQTGFRNLSYFAKCFKEKFGVSPSEFK